MVLLLTLFDYCHFSFYIFRRYFHIDTIFIFFHYYLILLIFRYYFIDIFAVYYADADIYRHLLIHYYFRAIFIISLFRHFRYFSFLFFFHIIFRLFSFFFHFDIMFIDAVYADADVYALLICHDIYYYLRYLRFFIIWCHYWLIIYHWCRLFPDIISIIFCPPFSMPCRLFFTPFFRFFRYSPLLLSLRHFSLLFSRHAYAAYTRERQARGVINKEYAYALCCCAYASVTRALLRAALRCCCYARQQRLRRVMRGEERAQARCRTMIRCVMRRWAAYASTKHGALR